jgi:hypothetical protein
MQPPLLLLLLLLLSVGCAVQADVIHKLNLAKLR